jgi:hypothetical protein
VYLASAREHPPAAVVRQQQHDIGLVAHMLRDLNERQSQLVFLAASALIRYTPPALQPLVDADIVEASGALAATFETSVKGVIYDHRPASLSAERVAAALKAVLAEAGKHGGTAFDRDAAVVLRRLEEGGRQAQSNEPDNRRAFVDLLVRVVGAADEASPGEPAHDEPRLIVP